MQEAEKISRTEKISEFFAEYFQKFSKQFTEKKKIKILMYKADQWEPNIYPTNGIQVEIFYPRVISDNQLELVRPESWTMGRYGIVEPVGDFLIKPDELDLFIIPGLGFDPSGVRLGRGKGYFDRCLESIESRKLVGIGWSFCFPLYFRSEKHDLRMGNLITDLGIFSFLD